MFTSVGRAVSLCLAAAAVPATAAAQATTPTTPIVAPTASATPAPPTPPAPTAGALAAFTVTDPYAFANAPTIAAAGDTVAWSSQAADGTWELHAAVAGKELTKVFEHAQWPIDVSLGLDQRGRAVMLWSRCSARTTAKTRWRAYGCDIRRITDPTSDSISREVSGVSTRGAAEFAPSRDGNTMVFARRPYGSDRPRLYERDLSTGRERKLPIGSKHFSCSAACADTGEIENGAVESSVLGKRFAMRWIDQEGIGESFSDDVYRGTERHLLGTMGPSGVVSGTCGTRRYSGVQLVSPSITQFVLREYSCDDTFGSVVGGRVRRVDAHGKAVDYTDPAKRRIEAAAADGDRLWVVRERLPVAAPTEGVPENPAPCTAWVGGCEVVAIDDPEFVPADR